MLRQIVSQMTEAAFLDWQLGQTERYELVDGQPRAMTGAKIGHDVVVVNALSALLRALRGAGSQCRPFTADIAVRVPVGNLRRPDVAVYCPPFDQDAMVSDRPRLVIEVLSESTRDTDQVAKLEEYRSIESLDYIILVAPHVADALVWSRLADRVWLASRTQVMTETIPLPALGILLPMHELYDGVAMLPPRPKLIVEG